ADPAKYRPEGELEKWKERDPIKLYRERLKQFGVSEDIIVAIEEYAKRRVDEATEKCKAAPPPATEILTTDVYADGGFAWRNCPIAKPWRAASPRKWRATRTWFFLARTSARPVACSRRPSACMNNSVRCACATRRFPSRRFWAPPWVRQ